MSVEPSQGLVQALSIARAVMRDMWLDDVEVKACTQRPTPENVKESLEFKRGNVVVGHVAGDKFHDEWTLKCRIRSSIELHALKDARVLLESAGHVLHRHWKCLPHSEVVLRVGPSLIEIKGNDFCADECVARPLARCSLDPIGGRLAVAMPMGGGTAWIRPRVVTPQEVARLIQVALEAVP